MANDLSILHSQQIEDGYCLPACAQMALAYLGIFRSQQEIGRILKIRRGFGTPAPNIGNLHSQQVEVRYHIAGTLDEISQCLQNKIPIIAFIQAGELPHWQGIRAQHAVLIVGISEQNVTLHDPAFAHGPTTVLIGDFLLAWDEMDNRYALITTIQRRSH